MIKQFNKSKRIKVYGTSNFVDWSFVWMSTAWWFVMIGLVPIRINLSNLWTFWFLNEELPHLPSAVPVWGWHPRCLLSVDITPGECPPPPPPSPLGVSSVLRSPGRPRAPAWLPVTRSQVSVGHQSPHSHQSHRGVSSRYRDNRTFKHDIYRKSFIEFCKNHQFRKLKEKIVFLSTQFKWASHNLATTGKFKES